MQTDEPPRAGGIPEYKNPFRPPPPTAEELAEMERKIAEYSFETTPRTEPTAHGVEPLVLSVDRKTNRVVVETSDRAGAQTPSGLEPLVVSRDRTTNRVVVEAPNREKAPPVLNGLFDQIKKNRIAIVVLLVLSLPFLFLGGIAVILVAVILVLPSGKPPTRQSAETVELPESRIDPKQAQLHVRRGIQIGAGGDWDAAITEFDKAIELDPMSAQAFLYRGISWSEKGDAPRAQDDFKQAARLDPKDGMIFSVRGDFWSKQGDQVQAINDLTEAIRLLPNSPPFGLRAVAHWLRRDADAAIRDLSAAIHRDPKDRESYAGRAWLQATHPEAEYRNGALALKDAKTACELSKFEDPYKLTILAAAHAETGDFVAAAEWQGKALKLLPESSKIMNVQRLFLYQERKPYREQLSTRFPTSSTKPWPSASRAQPPRSVRGEITLTESEYQHALKAAKALQSSSQTSRPSQPPDSQTPQRQQRKSAFGGAK